MTTIELFAKNEVLELVTSPTVSSGDVNEVELYVEFSEEWQGVAKVAVFFYDEFKEPFERLLENGRCKVPNEVLKNHVPFFVGIRGAKNDILKTTDIVKYTVTKGVPSIIKDVNVDIYQQILAGYAKLETIKDEVDADAKKTAEDRKEVERLVESVTGIDEQVAKVEELSKNAQEAATQAGTSAEQAELHKQAAETASSAAQTAAQETETDRTAVEKAKTDVESLSAQVQKNKESVDKTAQDFALNTQQALADVNNAGQTQTERVQTAGATAVENIKIAQNTATQAVETAKTEAIKTVADKGKEVLESIPNLDAKLDKKLDKNLGAEHAGKALVIGEDGNVVPGKPQTEGAGDAADAIVNTAKGNLLLIKDSSARKNKGFGMSGKTEQFSTRGVNLWDLDSTVIVEGTKSVMFNNPIQAGTYTLSAIFTNNKSAKESLFNFYNAQNQSVGNGSIKHGVRGSKTITLTGEAVKVLFYAGTGHDSSQGVTTTIKDIQLETGNNATEYEPYTGGKPSPSPEYPQEIMNAGRYNEGTGKYSVDVKVNGANLLNEDHFFDMGNWKNGKYYMNLKPDTKYTFSRKDNSGVGSGLFLSVKNTVEGVLTQIVNSNSASSCKQRVTFTTNDSGEIYFDLQNNNKLNLKDFLGFGQLEVGIAATPHEPYKEQTLTLTSDRPITKWDRLVERNGEIGWLYKSEIIDKFDGKSNRISMGAKKGEVQHFLIEFKNTPKGNGNADIYVDKYRAVQTSFAMTEFGVCCNWNDGIKYFSAPNINITNTEEFKAWLSENPLTLEYETETTEFLPLPQQEQDAIRALTTYYPTTVVSNSEDAEMQLTYVADTKNYTDNKIKEAVSAQTQNLANLLSLMPLSTQAAMIEADTNNILDMEVQK